MHSNTQCQWEKEELLGGVLPTVKNQVLNYPPLAF